MNNPVVWAILTTVVVVGIAVAMIVLMAIDDIRERRSGR